ncbi:MAG: L-threonylcarbamoyladenylate synthase [Salibacteraceae bacterium]
MTLISQNIDEAKKRLEGGELVAIPTETVYGMAANAFDEQAVKRIFAVKNRPFYDPLILHTSSLEKIASWQLVIPQPLNVLAEKYWPGPLTLLLPKTKFISDFVTAQLPRVAIRIPNHPMALALLEKLNFPLAAPSANPFGYVSPTTAQHVKQHFEGKINMILDGGDCDVGIESTIVGMEDKEVVVYRLGGLSLEKIETLVGPVKVKASSSKPDAPGMLIRHYSPGKEVIAIDSQEELNAISIKQTAFILYDLEKPEVHQENLIHLSRNASDEEAARNFYRALQHWEGRSDIRRIVIQRLPDFGLGRAINDRLKRAIGK